MILVVACAVAMAIMKQADPWQTLKTPVVFVSMTPSGWLLLWTEKWISPMLGALGIAFLVIRLRRPRPPLRRLFMQPGAMALTLSVLAICLGGLLALVGYIVSATVIPAHFGPHDDLHLRLSETLREATYEGGALILGGWLTLALSRRFRCGPDWIEQVSIFLGSCWIAVFLVPWICYRILFFTV